MTEVMVLGGGMHPFGRFPEKTLVEMGKHAAEEALADAGVPFGDVGIVYCGRVNAPIGTGWYIVAALGQTGIPVVNVEQACSSSSTAFRQAYWAIQQGHYDVALVVGFEKMERGMVGVADDASHASLMGHNALPGWYALKANTYMQRYGATPEMFGQVSVKSHRNGALNPMAQYQKPVSLEEVMQSRMIATPITLLQCAPTTDGAAALVLASEKAARKYSIPERWVRVAGWAAGTEKYAEEEEESQEPTGKRLAVEMYERAGLGPKDVNTAQVHDAFAPGEVFRLEALGLVAQGEGARFIWEGQADIDGALPVNTDGGLLSRGHPMGATGAAQVIEIVRQLRGEAGQRQIAGSPKVGVCLNSGLGGVNLLAFTK